MLIGHDFFGFNNGAVFDTIFCHPSYQRLEIYDGTIDQVYIDEDITIPYSIEKPNNWRYFTVLNAKFQGNLEGGSVQNDGLVIEKIRFQKRSADELIWQDVAEIEYTPNKKIFYEAIDKYIANDFVYEYSVTPITATVLGSRVISDQITANFSGVFLSDKENNYSLLYDVEISDIQNNNPSSIFEPLFSKYPIITYSNLDYSTFDVTATFITAKTVDTGDINIRLERMGKDQLMIFMKNRKPKVYRDTNGNLKLVSVVGNPKEIPNNNVAGIAKLSFSLVEIGQIDNETMVAYNLLSGLEEVF